MKKFLSGLAALVMLLSCMMAPAALADDKISIVTTISPIYDWVRQVAGDRLADIDLTMLLDNGVDLHSYQPTAQDILKVSAADLFIYVGGESDEWVKNVLEAAPNADIRTISLVDAMGEDIKMEEIVEGMEHAHGHSHEKKEVTEDRSIANYQGRWQSVYPYMSDPIFKSAAPFMAEAEGMGIEEAWNFFLKGNETTVRYITILGDDIEFLDENGESCKGTYAYDGWYSDCWGETSIRYQFKKVAGDEAAPTYVQFDDHLNYDTPAEHFHIYCGEDATAMLDIADSWPTYYSARIETADEMLAEFMEHYVDPHEMAEVDAHDLEVSTFEDDQVKNRPLASWAGEWQSAYPYAVDGSLDEGFAHKAESGKMTAQEYKDYYIAGYASEIAGMIINGDDSTIEFTDVNGNTCKSKYLYLGYYIQHWSTGTKAAMYRFEALDKDSGAPIYIEFNDHIIEPCLAEHYHFRASNTGFDDIEDPENTWPTFFDASLDAEGILAAFVGHDSHGHGGEIKEEDIADRPLTDFAGDWKSLAPMAESGELDAYFQQKAEEHGESVGEVRAEQAEKWASDAVSVQIKGDTITFTAADGAICSAAYTYAGYTPVLAEDGDIKAVRYNYTTDSADAPKYVQFNDHGYQPAEAEHFHFHMGSDGFDALMESATNSFFVPADWSAAQVMTELAGHGEHKHDHEHAHAHEHEEEADEHVWLSLRNAEKLVKVIADAMSDIDAANAEAYTANAAAYIEKLAALDGEYQKAVDMANVNTVLFGDRFPFRYLVDDYGLSYYAAFSGCSAESEASFATIVFLAQKVNELNLPAVMTIEGPNHKIAETVAAASDKKDAKILTMDSLQSTTSADMKNGATYLSVMENNLAVLKEALGL